MPGVLLTSYALIFVGILLVAGGLLFRYRGNRIDRYLLVSGGILVLLGLGGIGFFMRAFG